MATNEERSSVKGSLSGLRRGLRGEWMVSNTIDNRFNSRLAIPHIEGRERLFAVRQNLQLMRVSNAVDEIY